MSLTTQTPEVNGVAFDFRTHRKIPPASLAVLCIANGEFEYGINDFAFDDYGFRRLVDCHFQKLIVTKDPELALRTNSGSLALLLFFEHISLKRSVMP